MAYADIFATEARGMWSPPNGAAPQMIPDRWRDSPEDEIREDLPDKTDDELAALGWLKIDMPSYETKGVSIFTKSYTWSDSSRSYVEADLDDYQKSLMPNYDMFWTKLVASSVYSTLKTAASTTLAANMMLTEFIALLSDAKRELPNTTAIQASITAILAGITLTAEETTELEEVFNSTGMVAVYTFA